MITIISCSRTAFKFYTFRDFLTPKETAHVFILCQKAHTSLVSTAWTKILSDICVVTNEASTNIPTRQIHSCS